MKVFITGASGFVASHLIEFLLQQKEVEVYGTYRWRSSLENISHILKRINLVECEITDFLSVQKAVGEVKPDIIFHLAAQSYVPAGTNYPNTTIDVNIKGTINLLEAVRQAKVDPIIHICSSSDVYGGFDEPKTVTEFDIPKPCNLYSVSKLGQDTVGLQYYISYGLKTIRSRSCIKTGPRRQHVFAESAFAKQIAEIEAGLKEPVLKVGNLDSVRTFVDVRDAVKAYWLLVKKCRYGEAYNLSSDTTISIRKLLDMLLSFSNMKDQIKVEVDPKLVRLSDTKLPVFNYDKFKKETGWQPEIPFNKTLRDLLDYWRVKVRK